MVRYLDNKVVTIKGERYTEIKEDAEAAKEEAHKKTFVALKPARQYRFHWPYSSCRVDLKNNYEKVALWLETFL